MNFVVGTGYYNYNSNDVDDAKFLTDYWVSNTLKMNPKHIVIVNSNSEVVDCGSDKVEWINLIKNPLHVKDMSNDKSLFGGWSLSFINSAIYAYSCGCDFIYKEQDCLLFGDDAVERMYKCCEGKQMVTGELIEFPNDDYIIELSLMLLKRDFIPIFLSELMAIDKTDGGDGMRPETKFLEIRKKYKDDIGVIDFGYGGNRPYAYDDVFYIQKPRWNYIDKIEFPEVEKVKRLVNDIADLRKNNLI